MRKVEGYALLLLAFAVGPALAAAEAQLAQAQISLANGNAAEAKQLVDSALVSGSLTALQRGRLRQTRGEALELLGNPEAALVDFTAVLQTSDLPAEERTQALLQRGFLFDALGKLPDAIRDYSSAAKLKTSGSAVALTNRAGIYRRQNRLAEARQDYLASLLLNNPRPQITYYALGEIAEAQHDVMAARGFYAQALKVDPGYRPASDRLDQLVAGGTATTEEGVIHLRPSLKAPGERFVPPGRDALPSLRPKRAGGSRGRPELKPALDSGASGRMEVQLGAWRSEAEARVGWSRAAARSPSLLEGLSPHIITVELPHAGRFYRVRIASADPERLCSLLRGASQDCLVVPKQ